MELSKDWVFDKFDEGSLKLVGEIQLKKYGRFLDDYAEKLKGIEGALSDRITEAWDFTLDPISLQMLPTEQTSLFQLVKSNHKILNKVMIVIASLCSEIRILKHEAVKRFYPALLFYGEGIEDVNDSLSQSSRQTQMGRMIATLHDLSLFVLHCYEVVRNVIHQLSGLYTDDNVILKTISTSNVHLLPLWDHLADLLGVLITLDEIFESHTVFKEDWTAYKRALKSVSHAPSIFGVDETKLKPFEACIRRLEGQLLDGMIFQNCIEQMFDAGPMNVVHNLKLSDEFQSVLRLQIGQLDNILGESNDLNHRQCLPGVIGLLVMHHQIYRATDKKIFRALWDMYKRVPCVTLTGNITWFPTKFLSRKLPDEYTAMDKKALNVVLQSKLNFIRQRNTTVIKDSQQLYLEVSSWMIEMESTMDKTTVLEKATFPVQLSKRCSLFIHGVSLSFKISNLVNTMLNLHVALEKPMTKASVMAICKLIELLKSIEFTFHHRSLTIASLSSHIIAQLEFKCMSILSLARKRLTANSERKYNERKLDVLASIMLAENCLHGAATKDRRLVLSLAVAVAVQIRILKDDELTLITGFMKELTIIYDLHELVRTACNSAFLYWHKVILSVYLAAAFESMSGANRIQYMFGALRDCIPQMWAVKHLESPNILVDSFHKEIMSMFEDKFLFPLCKAIEEDLRLCIHTHLKLDDRNPYRVQLNDLGKLLHIRPIRFLDQIVNVKDFISHYLERQFYNHTTLASYDWKTYGLMRNLAEQKYSLTMDDPRLPSQTLEQGLDVLEIMKNIHVFVSRYLYSLNNQVFIEKSSQSKHLNTINIRHVANSIRTHGTGIINTTVNFTYQFLRKKFFIFSQFLYDEHIKARLIKDIRYYRENKQELKNKYPFERAEKFNRGIRKLGLSDGISYLDQFRELISQIGNAMGYIRLMRSGSIHCVSNSIRFIPDLEDIVTFKKMVEDDNLSEESIEAADMLDSVISNMTKNFAEGTEYFQILVDVFRAELRSPKNIHLKYFYVICPPLILNFVEHMIQTKERLNKKNKTNAAFTDDGFTMGVAYILKLLDQYHEFDSLHWFHSVIEKYTDEKASTNKQRKQSLFKDDEKLSQTMSLTLKRLDTYQREFELVFYSLSSARIFFHGHKEAPDEMTAVDKRDVTSVAGSDVANTGDLLGTAVDAVGSV